jgi:hypothetical protein
MGSAAFLAPLMVTSPFSFLPPLMMIDFTLSFHRVLLRRTHGGTSMKKVIFLVLTVLIRGYYFL